jgi:hypothetical protein
MPTLCVERRMGAEALDNDGSAAMPLYHAKLSFAVATQHVSVWLRLIMCIMLSFPYSLLR